MDGRSGERCEEQEAQDDYADNIFPKARFPWFVNHGSSPNCCCQFFRRQRLSSGSGHSSFVWRRLKTLVVGISFRMSTSRGRNSGYPFTSAVQGWEAFASGREELLLGVKSNLRFKH